MNLCLMCKHWTPPGPWDYVHQGGARVEDFGHCQRGQGDDGHPVDHDTLAFGDDAESYRSYLRTRPHFGCIQHQPKT